MSPLNPLFCIIVYLIAFLTVYLILLKYKPWSDSTRYVSIDGLRGFSAFAIFIHHATLWQKYSSTGVWEIPNSNFYTQIGQSSVGLFFMITSFLFVSQLIKSRDDDFNWKTFAISRVYRIFPLYYIVLIFGFIILFTVSSWTLNVPLDKLFWQIKDWILFTIIGSPDINEVKNTVILGFGVAWTLAYEWLFYFSLPIISFFILKKRTKPWILLISIAFVAFFFIKRGHLPSDSYGFYFIAGGIAPFINKYSKIQHNINKHILSCIVLICMALLLREQFAQNLYSISLNTLIFTIIATGNNVFGVLKQPFLRLLGEISYSTYLLHGFALFITFNFIINAQTAKTLSPTQYCLIIFLLTPVLVILSFLSYRFIEQPFIGLGKKVIKRKTESSKIIN